jgi:aminopeptidase N
VDWYPFIPPYRDGEGWLISAAAAQGEHLAYESADFDVRIRIVNAPALTRIAAPAPAAEISDGTFAYHLENARRFSWSASGNYQREGMQTNINVPVTVYFFEEDRNAAEASMRAAARAIEIYSELFGAYPYETLSIVECNFPDGMESDGLFFLDINYFREYNYKDTNLLTTLSAHETAHNWWFGLVGNDPANEPWLDEALATYSELIFYERAHPEDVDWWWDFRVNQWEPTGWVDGTIYELADFRPYVNAVYLRGVQFLDEVRTTMGDEAFLAFFKEYVQQGAGQIVTGEELLRLLTDSTDEDLNSILNKYFRPADQ